MRSMNGAGAPAATPWASMSGVQVIPVDRIAGPPTKAERARARTTPRADALPEYQEYRDEGCDLFPSCLSCPLARCRYDEPGGVRALLNRERDRAIRSLREDEGVPVDEIARRFQVSRRTVFRVLAAGGRGAGS